MIYSIVKEWILIKKNVKIKQTKNDEIFVSVKYDI